MAGPCATLCWPRTRRKFWGSWKSQRLRDCQGLGGPRARPELFEDFRLGGKAPAQEKKDAEGRFLQYTGTAFALFLLSFWLSGDLQPVRGRGNAEALHSPASEPRGY